MIWDNTSWTCGHVAAKGRYLMDCKNDQRFETINVTPGADATGSLSVGKPLRFERAGNAMTGTPALYVANGQLALHYADGASVYINA